MSKFVLGVQQASPIPLSFVLGALLRTKGSTFLMSSIQTLSTGAVVFHWPITAIGAEIMEVLSASLHSKVSSSVLLKRIMADFVMSEIDISSLQ